MNQRIGPLASFVIISLIAVVDETSSFAFSQHHVRVTKSRSCRVGLLSSLGENEGQQSSAQKNQEQIMERASISGAEEIAKISLEERTKRAMLAEAVEDRIFDLADELDILVAKNGGLENLSGEIKEEAVEMAKQTKALQIQYDDLVNGRPSQILDMEMKESN
mmetsp:Transcript_28069/g.52987  ORF Transcript_28069/g.52987 Transcript_28069/m.52987 type:complete len:163 (+) Transcript_28069:3-491(+)